MAVNKMRHRDTRCQTIILANIPLALNICVLDNESIYVDSSGHSYINITKKLNNAMIKNATSLIQKLKRMRYLPTRKLRAAYLFGLEIYFAKEVKGGGEWDLKTQWSILIGQKTNVYKYKYKNKLLRADDPGNIHFGFVGSVLFSQMALCIGAGAYQVKSFHSHWNYYKSYFDDPRDTEMIKYGCKLYEKWKATVKI